MSTERRSSAGSFSSCRPAVRGNKRARFHARAHARARARARARKGVGREGLAMCCRLFMIRVKRGPTDTPTMARVMRLARRRRIHAESLLCSKAYAQHVQQRCAYSVAAAHTWESLESNGSLFLAFLAVTSCINLNCLIILCWVLELHRWEKARFHISSRASCLVLCIRVKFSDI